MLFVFAFVTTAKAATVKNLLLNPGAEDGTTGSWFVSGGTNVQAIDTNGTVSPHTGDYFFDVTTSPEGDANFYQYPNFDIRLGGQPFVAGGWIRANGNYDGLLNLTFSTGGGDNETFTSGPIHITGTSATWTSFIISGNVPSGKSEVLFQLTGTSADGNPLNIFYDDLYLNFNDTDEDGVLDGIDNCKTIVNPDQQDSNDDGIGDACQLVSFPIYEGGSSCGIEEGETQVLISGLTTTIDSRRKVPIDVTLPSVGEYLFEAIGTYNYGGDSVNNWADAAYVTTNNWTDLRDSNYGIDPDAKYRGVLSLLSDMGTGNMGIVNWGPTYNTDMHNYKFLFTPESTTVQFVISDWWDFWYIEGGDKNNQRGISDNSGSLTLNVYRCVTAPPVIENPTNKDQCKNGGWKIFNNPTFKNQGGCVAYVQAN